MWVQDREVQVKEQHKREQQERDQRKRGERPREEYRKGGAEEPTSKSLPLHKFGVRIKRMRVVRDWIS